MRKFGLRLLCPLLLLGFTGCPTPPKTQPRLTPLPEGAAPEPVAAQAEAPAPTPQASLPKPEPPQQLALVRVPPIVPAPLLPPSKAPTNWIAWQTWAKSFARSRSGPYEIQTTNGLLALKVGYREAAWNGTPLSLGFPAILTNGQAHIHQLDALKNFEALLAPDSGGARTNRVLVLDPGHGGENPGAKSAVAEEYEKDLTLDWARRIQKLLSQKGWRVYLTRTNDDDISLTNRVALADQWQGDLFLSLHFNSLETSTHNGGQTGLETYCLTPVGMPSTLTRAYEDNPTRVYPNNAFDEQNIRYAMRLHRSLVTATGRKDRGVRRARFMTVLREQNRPAVLLEGGYLSDPQEARLLSSPAYRQKLAEAVANALE